MGIEEEVSLLLKIREKYQNQLKEMEKKVEEVKLLISVIDRFLAEKSFTKAVDLSKTEKTPKLIAGETIELVSSKGEPLGRVKVTESEVEIIPNPSLNLDVRTPPFSPFLIRKVLLGMKLADENARVRGELKKEDVMDFKVEEVDNILRKILVRNYRDPNRIKQIVRAAKWTFETMIKNMRERRG